MEKCIVTVPKGAEYLIGGKKRLKEGEPLPLPQKGDIFKTKDYIFKYGKHMVEYATKEGTYWDAMKKFDWSVVVKPESKEQDFFEDLPWIIGNRPIINMDYAFEGCKNMKVSPEIPPTVTQMNGTYANCKSLEILPALSAYVENIDRIFKNCTKISDLSDYKLPLYVKTMAEAFIGCRNMTEIPKIEHLEYLKNAERAFAECTSLGIINDFKLPATLKKYDDMFRGCNNIKFQTEKPKNKKSQEIITDKTIGLSKLIGTLTEKTMFIRNNGQILQDDERIPDTIQTGDEYHLGDYIFKYNYRCCEKIDGKIGWEKHESQHGWGVLYRGDKEKEDPIAIPEKVLYLPVVNADYAFANNPNIKTLQPVPDTIVSMKGTFKNCISLQKAPVLSAAVTSIEGAFENCESMISFEKGNKKTKGRYSRPVSMVSFPSCLENMNGAFKGCKSLIDVPDFEHTKVKTLTSTFEECTGLIDLSKLRLPTLDSCNKTFYRCDNLQYPPHKLSAQQMYLTFGRCPNLKVAPEIGTRTKDITGMFAYCINLEKPSNRLAETSNKAYYMCNNLKELPKSCGSVVTAESAFEGCISLQEIYDIATLVKLENARRMFMDCEAVTQPHSIVMPENIKNAEEMFCGCKNMKGDLIVKTMPENQTDMIKGTKLETRTFAYLQMKNMVNNIVPEGAKYYSCGIKTPLTAGEHLPELKNGDRAIIGNFEYKYNEKIDGWEVKTLEQSKVKKQIGGMMDIINGKVIKSIEHTFENCDKMIFPPKLPQTIVYADNAFKNCTALTGAPSLPMSIKFANRMFQNCTKMYTHKDEGGKYGDFANFRLPKDMEQAEDMFDGCEAIFIRPDISACSKLENKSNVFSTEEKEITDNETSINDAKDKVNRNEIEL